MAQNGDYVHLIDDFYFTLLSGRVRRSPYYDSVDQFIAHLARKFGRVEIFLNAPYKLIGTLYCVFRFGKLYFQFRDLGLKFLLLFRVFLYKSQADILGHFTFYPVFVCYLYQAGYFFRAFTFCLHFLFSRLYCFIRKLGIMTYIFFTDRLFVKNDPSRHFPYIFKYDLFQNTRRDIMRKTI